MAGHTAPHDSGHPDPAVPTALLADRIRRAGDVAAEHGVDLLLVTPGTDLRYLLDAEGASHERLTAWCCPRPGTARRPRWSCPAGGAGLGRPGAGRPRRRGRHLERRRGPLPAGQRPGRRPYLPVADTMPAKHVFGLREALPEARRRWPGRSSPSCGARTPPRSSARAAGAAIDRCTPHGRVPQGGRSEAVGGSPRHRRGGPHRGRVRHPSARGRTGPARTTTCRTG